MVALCGKNRVAVAALGHLVHVLDANWPDTRLVAVPNAGDEGKDGWQPSFRAAAQRLGVPIVDMASLHPVADLVLVSLEYDKIIRTAKFASQRLYNIHFSALPAYRGVFTSMWPILNGETHSGVTLHFIDPGIDTGAIVAQRLFGIPSYCTSRQLYEMFLDHGIELFRSSIASLLSGTPAGVPQDEAKASYYSRSSLDLSQREIDLTAAAERISRFVRTMAFPEYQLPTLSGRRVRNCRVVSGSTSERAGTLLRETELSSSFATGDGGIVELVWD